MAIRSSDQISIVDVTDAYSVILTSEAYTFAGSTSAAKAGSTTTQIIAMCGASQVAAKVIMSEITKPSGVTVTSDNNATAPTLTISVTTSVTSAGVVKIPVHIGDITINKEFSYAIAFTGATGQNGSSITIKSTSVTYFASSSGTSTPSDSENWTTSVPTVANGQYLWTKTVVTYSDNTSTKSYSVSYKGTNGSNGTNGTSVTVSSTSVKYVASNSGTEQPSSGWQDTVPTVNNGQYLWTQTIVVYSDGKRTEAYSVSYKGTNGTNGKDGEDGADAITLSITSSNGTIFKNSAIETVLTAHVYKAGVELNTTQIAALGTIKWYKDGSTTACGTGATLTIDAGDVTNKASFIAQLEG